MAALVVLGLHLLLGLLELLARELQVEGGLGVGPGAHLVGRADGGLGRGELVVRRRHGAAARGERKTEHCSEHRGRAREAA